MLPSHKTRISPYRFFKTSLWKVCAACPEICQAVKKCLICQIFMGNMTFFGS